jgi:dihydrodipicolinate synthase/N-acetylneuraminate lyase
VLVMPPYFAHLTEAEVIGHFERVDAASGPADPAVQHPRQCRKRDDARDRGPAGGSGQGRGRQGKQRQLAGLSHTLYRVKDRIRVFCGPSSVFGVPAVLAGADGLIDCFPNVWAPGCLDLWHATKAGRMDEAWELQHIGIALTELFTTEGRTLYPATKAAMNHDGPARWRFPRPPLRRWTAPRWRD